MKSGFKKVAINQKIRNTKIFFLVIKKKSWALITLILKNHEINLKKK